VPIPSRSKSPQVSAWQNLSVNEADVERYFGSAGNIGIILGVDGLTDVDLDCAEAVTAGRYLLPQTGMIFGRASKPSSHYCYLVTPAAPMEKLLDPTDHKATLCEFRCLKKDGGIGLQTVFPPSMHPSGEAIEFSRNGEPARIDEVTLRRAFRQTAAAALLARHWPEAGAGRHDTMLALAGVLARSGWPQQQALTFCRAVYVAVPTHDPVAVTRVDAEVSDTYKAQASGRQFTGFPKLRDHLKNSEKVLSAVTKWLGIEATDRLGLVAAERTFVGEDAAREEVPEDPREERKDAKSESKLSELGLAGCLLRKHSSDLRYVAQQKQWLFWSGQCWTPDITQEVKRRTIQIVQEMDAKDCKSDARVNGATRLASADKRVAVTSEAFDQNDSLLNFRNGTLNLHTGELSAHRQTDLITKLVPVDYNSSALAPRWDRFLREVFEPHPDLPEWLQRAIGYSLTADVREHCFFLMLGSGRNGKGVFINTLKELFSSYAHQADFRAFQPKYGDGPLDAIANFKGSRIVIASEGREGSCFDEALMKALTGGDPIRARRLHENSFEIKPTFKIWLASNYRPQIRGTDPGIWSRVRLIPFEASFAGREDRSLQETLRSEAPGIIAWAVEGALRWREEGLEPLPEAVRAATESYRSESDALGRFLAEGVERGEMFSVGARELYRAYTVWADEIRESCASETAFGRQMAQRTILKTHTSSGNQYHGIRLKPQMTS